MSESVTWESCPRCGSRAAVGWAPVGWNTGREITRLPVEFDCEQGCEINDQELVQIFGLDRQPRCR